MADFHFHVTQIKRSAGQSAVACAAYRAGEKLFSEYYGEINDFTHKNGVIESGIMLPDYVPKKFADRQVLWNEVEKVERGKKAQLAYSFDFSLQNEFTLEENTELAKKFIAENFVGKGMIADFAIHLPEKEGTPNPHVHVICPIRPIDRSGKWGNKQKRVYELDDNGERLKNESGNYIFSAVPTTDWGSPETLEHWRNEWANLCNEKFEEKGLSVRIDNRSYKRQGIDTIPTIHEGPAVRHMEKRGIKTDKGGKNRLTKLTNKLLAEIKEKLKALRAWLTEAKTEYDINLSDLLNDYLDVRKDERSSWNRYAQNKGAIADLKTISNAIIILQNKNISSLDELNEFLIPVEDLRKSIKNTEKKIKKLKQHISKIEDYEKYKPVFDKYSRIFFEKSKEKYYVEHESEIEKYKTALRYMKANPECKPELKDSFKSEIAKLSEKQKEYVSELSDLQSSLDEFMQIKNIINEAIKQKNSVSQKIYQAKKFPTKTRKQINQNQEFFEQKG